MTYDILHITYYIFNITYYSNATRIPPGQAWIYCGWVVLFWKSVKAKKAKWLQRLREALLDFLESSGRPIGVPWEPLGATWRPLGDLLRASWELLEVSWVIL